jgi:hypothetical protein
MMGREEIIAALRQQASEMWTLCNDLSDAEMRRAPKEGEWSILEICCHVRDTTNVAGERIRRLVGEDQPRFKRDPRRADVHAGYPGEDPRKVLVAARALLTALAYQLEGLSQSDWERGGEHATRGPVTVWSQADLQARHAARHTDEMKAIHLQSA